MAESEDQGGGGGTDPRMEAISEYTLRTFKVRLLLQLCSHGEIRSFYISDKVLSLYEPVIVNMQQLTCFTRGINARVLVYRLTCNEDRTKHSRLITFIGVAW